MQTHFKIDIQKGGRVTIPYSVRKALNLVEGDVMSLTIDEDEMRLTTIDQDLEEARQLLNVEGATPLGSVEDFLQWRREEARHEEGKIQRMENGQ